jgi:hypothetical protein
LKVSLIGNKLCKNAYVLPDLGWFYEAYFGKLPFDRMEAVFPNTDDLSTLVFLLFYFLISFS